MQGVFSIEKDGGCGEHRWNSQSVWKGACREFWRRVAAVLHGAEAFGNESVGRFSAGRNAPNDFTAR